MKTPSKLMAKGLFIVTLVVSSLYVILFIFSNDIYMNGVCKEKSVPAQMVMNTYKMNEPPWGQYINFTEFDNEAGTKDGHYIVPNYIHFIQFGKTEFNFAHAICILAAFKHQRPEKIFFHTDVEQFQGKYWDVIMSTPGFKDALVMRKMQLPTEIFGQKLSRVWKYYHGGDVARLRVMMEFGGIYLDNDSYVVRSLDDFRRFEMAIGWQFRRPMGNQILVAHKDARFLKQWYESYRNNYQPSEFYMNAGTYPTRYILNNRPYLVHRVPQLFGNFDIKRKAFLTAWPEWRDYYALHLLTRHIQGMRDPNKKFKIPPEFNETSVLEYPIAFRDMCIAVYPYKEHHKLLTRIK